MQFLSISTGMPENPDGARARFDRYRDLSARYRDDASLRARLDGGDTADSLATLGVDIPDGVEAKVVVDTPEIMHFVLPSDPNVDLADEAFGAVAGGKSFGTASTNSTLACSCVLSSTSTAGTASSTDLAGVRSPSRE